MKKKILVFIGASYVSGLEIVTLHLINELILSGYDVRCIINGWNDGVFKEKLREKNIFWYEVKLGWIHLRKPLWTVDTLIHWPAAYLKCKKILKNFKPDICHFCGYTQIIMISGLLKNLNCVYNLQEPHIATKKHLFIYKHLNKRIKIFVGVSDYIGKVLSDLQIPSKKIKIIYNGIPELTILPQTNRENELSTVLGIIGQVAAWKGHETLINAVELLSKNTKQKFIVYIFGDQENYYANTLKKKIKDKKIEQYFEWKGFVKSQDNIYKDVDIIIVPSLSQEPCSITIIESMMREKILVVSDRGGNIELVDNNKTGFVFEANDPIALSNCILNAIIDPISASLLASNARKKALLNYTSKRMEIDYVHIYSSLY